MHHTAVRILTDNLVWLMRRGESDPLIIVDPGQSAPVISAIEEHLRQGGGDPAAILLTHHHPDHIGGVQGVLARWPHLRVIAPTDPRIEPATERVSPDDVVDVAGFRFEVLNLAAHTTSQIGFYESDEGFLMCGDAIFSLGCGRLFEGTPQQLWDVMQTIAKLPSATQIFAAHEYTLSNSKFALHVDPNNADLIRYAAHVNQLRAADENTLPTTLATELACNPFLRAESPAIINAIQREFPHAANNSIDRIGALREWKDQYAG